MHDPSPSLSQPRADLIAEIGELKTPLDSLIAEFREVVARLEEDDVPPGRRSGQFWVLAAFTDALVRLRMFLVRNFNYLETLGVLALTRYVFELTIWLRLLHKDPRYGRVYCRMVLATQLDYYTDLRDHLGREIIFLRSIDAQEKELMKERAESLMKMPAGRAQKEAAFNLTGEIHKEIDRLASRAFSLYGEQARTNGYGFQAMFIENRVLPEIAQSIAQLNIELGSIDGDLPDGIRTLVPKKTRDWNWRAKANKVEMQEDYEFIYRYIPAGSFTPRQPA